MKRITEMLRVNGGIIGDMFYSILCYILKFSTKYMYYGVHLIEFNLNWDLKESQSPKCPRAEELESSAKTLWLK